jgi:hypothetical protein
MFYLFSFHRILNIIMYWRNLHSAVTLFSLFVYLKVIYYLINIINRFVWLSDLSNQIIHSIWCHWHPVQLWCYMQVLNMRAYKELLSLIEELNHLRSLWSIVTFTLWIIWVVILCYIIECHFLDSIELI